MLKYLPLPSSSIHSSLSLLHFQRKQHLDIYLKEIFLWTTQEEPPVGSTKMHLASSPAWFCRSALTAILQTIKWNNCFCYLRGNIAPILHRTQWGRGKVSDSCELFQPQQANHRKGMARSQTQPWKEHQLCFKLAVSCCVHHTYNKMLMSKNIPMYPEKNHNNCDSVLIQDIKNKKEELVLGCVKKGKNTVFTLYIP